MADKTKVTAKIWRLALDRLNEKMESLCLRRDAYLSKVLEVEIDHLDNEIPTANSKLARKFIAERLNLMDRETLTIAIPSQIAARVNEVTEEKNIVRDSFYNRLIFILAATPTQINDIYFGDSGGWTTQTLKWFDINSVALESMYPLNSVIDPLWGVRAGIELYNEKNTLIEKNDKGQLIRLFDSRGDKRLADGVYSTPFLGTKSCDLRGLNCYLADWQIPTSESGLHRRKRLAEIDLKELDGLGL